MSWLRYSGVPEPPVLFSLTWLCPPEVTPPQPCVWLALQPCNVVHHYDIQL